MSTLEIAGQAMMQMHEANRGLASSLSGFFAGLFSREPQAEPLLGSISFFQQEPDLAKETHLPGTYSGSL